MKQNKAEQQQQQQNSLTRKDIFYEAFHLGLIRKI